MSNVHAHPDDSYSDKLYFDSSLPGGVIYQAEQVLDWKSDAHPAMRDFMLQQYQWALYGEELPPQRPQFYKNLELKKQYYGMLARPQGSFYYGPDAPVIAASLRPLDAEPLKRPADN